MKTALHIHFWADIRNSTGSVEKVICALAAGGSAYRHSIACCISGHGLKGGRFDTTPYEYLGIPVFPFVEDRLRNRVLNKLLGLGAFTYSGLVRIINRDRPEVLHFHNRQNLVDAVVGRLDYRPAVVVHYHNNFRHPGLPQRADALVCPSRAAAQHLAEKLPLEQPCVVLMNPLTLEIIAQADAAGEAPRNPVPIILYGGGNQPIKGIAELLQAFDRLPPGTARLLLAGQNCEQMERPANPAIEIVGRLKAADFFDLMRRADIVVMPSHDETFGLIAQEAMFLRKLLVVARSGGLAEFTDDDCVIGIAPKDVDSLEAGLRRALALLGSGEALALVERARQRVAAFRPEAVTQRLEAVYDQAVAKVAA